MPITQLFYWASKADEDAKRQARDAEKARKQMARSQKRFKG